VSDIANVQVVIAAPEKRDGEQCNTEKATPRRIRDSLVRKSL
jgi:hypothetical protein